MTPTPLPFSYGTPPGRPRRRHRWPAAALCGLWLIEGWWLSRETADFPSGDHAHLVVWVAGLLVVLCVLPWAGLPVRALAASGVSWSATGCLLAFGVHVPAWGFAESAALLMLLALVAWRVPVRAALPLGVALAAGVLAAPVRDANTIGTTVVVHALVVAGVAALGLCLRYRDAERAEAVAAARDAERLGLAGELHDFVSHHVAAMTLLARATGSLAKDERIAASLRDIEEAGDEAMTSARRLLRVLHQDQPHREPLPGAGGLTDLVDDFHRTNPGAPRVTLHIDPCFDAGLAPELAASVHRIVGEALANVARHSPGASAVRVTLRRAGHRLFVSVHDDGAAPGRQPHRTPEDSGGLGLVGLTERADAIGGTLTAGPVPGGGWEVLAALPVRP
ncbi:sensor histidine kinase [Streptomyces netropsis]